MSEDTACRCGVAAQVSPLDGMKKENLARWRARSPITQLPASRTLFKEGDNDKRTYWLVSGMLELREGDRTVAMIRGGTRRGAQPALAQLPRTRQRARRRPIEYLASTANCST